MEAWKTRLINKNISSYMESEPGTGYSGKALLVHCKKMAVR